MSRFHQPVQSTSFCTSQKSPPEPLNSLSTSPAACTVADTNDNAASNVFTPSNLISKQKQEEEK